MKSFAVKDKFLANESSTLVKSTNQQTSPAGRNQVAGKKQTLNLKIIIQTITNTLQFYCTSKTAFPTAEEMGFPP